MPAPKPASLDPYALHGLAHKVVRLIAPNTEASPAVILVQFLVAFGAIVGRKPHWMVGVERHGVNLFAAIISITTRAGRSSSWQAVRSLFEAAAPAFTRSRMIWTLGSAETLVNAVRDPSIHGYFPKDEGAGDNRALFVESEFGATLAQLAREGNTLSATLRQAWDGRPIESGSKSYPIRSSHPHISIISHCTAEDLRARMTSGDAPNGFANRFLWVVNERSIPIPDPQRPSGIEFTEVVHGLTAAIVRAMDLDGPITRTPAAKGLWGESYAALTEPTPGLVGHVTSRAAAHVMRLACLYALLDESDQVDVDHLTAALALWTYCEQSARYIFDVEDEFTL